MLLLMQHLFLLFSIKSEIAHLDGDKKTLTNIIMFQDMKAKLLNGPGLLDVCAIVESGIG